MSAQTPKIIVLITGYIGGSVLSGLLNLPNALAQFDFRAIVRDPGKAQRLTDEFGVKGIVGSHSDQELMSKEAAEADVVLAMANCDDVDAAEGILKGLKKRYEATGKAPVLIHTSGTGVLCDPSDKERNVIWNDEDVAQLNTVLPNAVHRPTEVLSLAADREGYVRTFIISPSTVYASTSNALVQAGISNSRTPLYKYFVPIAIARGSGVLIGTENSVWPNVSIDEVTELYILLFRAIVDGSKDIPHGLEGYFTLGSDEYKWKDVFGAISQALFDCGKLDRPEPTNCSREEFQSYFGPARGPLYDMIASNVRVLSNRAKKLGWDPRKTTKDLMETIGDEVLAVVRSA
ncbi:hypothetical protein V5O48_014435 [Marasmius crinis-equi]|uniref:NAD(P)-binding domain-containing protein n=1 Tax=Marasmius crinis-equi TaxID=585013 RepID=A0ABR3EXM7_9AGAR